MSKRLYDVFFAALGLIVFSPVFLVVALVVKLSDGGPIFYRQKRVGQFGKLFWIWKFRTMVMNADRIGLSITKDGDPRITKLGRILRKTKLDEIPQLINVLRGEMSFVGPRPEVPCYVERYTPAQREILKLRPGITDIATLKFRNEEHLLRSASDEEAFYVEHCIPHKIELNLLYARNANLCQDTRIIFQTLCPLPSLHSTGFFHELTQLIQLNTENLHNRPTAWGTYLRMKSAALGRHALLGGVYALGLMASYWLAAQLRFDFAPPASDSAQLIRTALWILPLQLAALAFMGQFNGLLSYFSVPDLRRLAFGLGASSLVIFSVWFSTNGAGAPPRSVIVADCLFSLLAVCSIRLGFRMLRERYLPHASPAEARAQRVGIIGAGDAGAALARELLEKPRLGLQPVLFFDDERRKWHSKMYNIPVIGPPECVIDHKNYLQLDRVIVALPSASRKRLQEISRILKEARVKFEVLPSLDQLATGEVRVSPIKPVDIQDLLGREPVHLQKDNIRDLLAGKTVMVTGAGGSIGSELCRQIATFNPQHLLLVEQSEVQIFQIEQELTDMGYSGVILPVVADILDTPRMRYIFERYQPQVVFHAAAHKHVPIMEAHPSEAIKNNTLGTAVVADLALEYGVANFVLISTDKAINPTSVMGATKRLAEIYLQALQARNPGRTRFMAVRFGNVLGSSGSVIPMFLKQIAAGGPVKITHPEVTRYFMTIPEAAGLVLQSVAQGEGGEIFVLDMGKPIKIVDLARKLIELSGFKPLEDIGIEFIGLRPGEKLFEEINYKSEDIIPTNHPKIMRLVSQPDCLEEVRGQLQDLSSQLHTSEASALKLRLKQVVPEYEPCLGERSRPLTPTRESAVSRASINQPALQGITQLAMREFAFQPARQGELINQP